MKYFDLAMVVFISHLSLVQAQSIPLESYLCGVEEYKSNDDWEVDAELESQIDLVMRALEQKSDVVSLETLAMCSIKMRQFEMGRLLLEQVLSIDGNRVSSLDLLAQISLFEGSIIEAIRYLETSLEVNENNLYAYYYLTYAFLELNDLDAATATVAKAIQLIRELDPVVNYSESRLSPIEVILYIALADVAVNDEDYQQAIDMLIEGLRRNGLSDRLFDKAYYLVMDNVTRTEVEDLVNEFCELNVSSLCRD